MSLSEVKAGVANRTSARMSRKKSHAANKHVTITTTEINEDFRDDSSDDGDKKVRDSPVTTLRNMYRQMCNVLRVIPSTRFTRQLGSTKVVIKDYGLHRKELRAIIATLLNDSEFRELEFIGQRFQRKEATYISRLVHAKPMLTRLVISNNHLSGPCMKILCAALIDASAVRHLNLSGNGLLDHDSDSVIKLIEEMSGLRELILNNNELGACGIQLGKAIGENDTIKLLDLSWNHIRGQGAVGIARGLMENTSLKNLNLAWNGFGFEGCVALSQALQHNTNLQILDLSNNRIHPPAIWQLIEGVVQNKTLTTLKLALNPIPANVISVVLDRIFKNKHCGLKELDLQGIVVDMNFLETLAMLEKERLFLVRYETILRKGDKSLVDVTCKNVYNVDPIKILFFMKHHLRSIDLLLRYDTDSNGVLSREELKNAFEAEGYPISDSALDTVINYLDVNNDGQIDLIELIEGERKMKRKQLKKKQDQDYLLKLGDLSKKTKMDEFSQTFKKPQKTLPTQKKK
ncbi:leucine-rich repeat-containing protein 74B-like [Gigantopelta aegis]|uniref:leucine-rich repeat-containing protein 74B-like n=1 Tax=Gigantopelta aegis TaxID=1735272 RepID=UPI001B88DC36|nr:leucine-rich repeat-containing protein 74B-like [Gigantopelta aegis]